MARSSPGVSRVAAILNFMADHPGQSFALTDLVRALRISRATCHALLTGLVEEGYLYRASDKTYVLGPALARIAQAAAVGMSPLQIAQPEMRQLADLFDVVCGAYFLEGDTVHLRDRAASVSHLAYPVPLGSRMKLRPAMATAFLAHAPDTAEAWMAASPYTTAEDQRTVMRKGMEFVRTHGFIAIARKPGIALGDLSPETVFEGEGAYFPFDPLAAIDPQTTYPVVALFAPVLDEEGRAAFVLGMAGFSERLGGSSVLEAGDRLRAATARISGFVAGRGR